MPHSVLGAQYGLQLSPDWRLGLGLRYDKTGDSLITSPSPPTAQALESLDFRPHPPVGARDAERLSKRMARPPCAIWKAEGSLRASIFVP
ncbi:hypothetical protein [Variovorax paradoxus]|uniref:Uncharacterized protein n=1 Tax=Variovorax paradoxus TaxID=34073 RepID=A0A0H2MC19_VARPD|nr:hypothetical protein [Variovorax paradoxus]KLN54510.1 hypothetical protein VPARA_44320 [Variovorax paradoxus]